MEFNLLDYLIKNNNTHNARYLNLIKYELGKSISYFGEHFSSPLEGSKKSWFRDNLIYDCFEFFLIKIFSGKQNLKQKKILSSANLSWNEHFKSMGYEVDRPPWNLRKDFQITFSLKLYLLTKKIQRKFQIENFNYLISKDFFDLIDEYKILLKKNCIKKSYNALIIEDYNSFFNKLISEIFKELNKPIIFWHHGGIPANYELSHQNRADFFVLMGKRQVDDYIKVGYSPSKFFAAGHPVYNKSISFLKFNLKNILIITKAVAGYCPLEKSNLQHRSQSILYLKSIEKVLKRMGVKKAFLRPHPSECFLWYSKYVDTKFFKKSKSSLKSSLKRASLVIGPISTTIIDSLYNGVNYVVYEPIVNKKTIIGGLLTPPLDGKDPRFPVAHSESQLENILINNKKISTDFYTDLVKTPRDISFLKKIIK